MPTSEVKPGMTGYCLTSLQGVRPEKLPVEVLGVMPGAFPKSDVILIRLGGPVMNETGVIAGMSGSPVYVGDKLLGAVALGWRFCKAPLAGVTPAQQMMKVRQIDLEAGAKETAAAKDYARQTLRARTQELAKLLASPDRSLEAEARIRKAVLEMAVPPSLEAFATCSADNLPPAVRGLLPDGVEPALRPLPIPIAVSGTAGGALLSSLTGGGFMLVQAAAPATLAPAADGAAMDELKLEPGMPVGAALVTGDMEISGMGTLTWIGGGRALAFGHPLLGLGDTNIPLAVGEVRTIVPSLNNSFRLTATGPIIGRITQDREAAILARIGEKAPTFPCKVRVSGAVNDEYNYRIAGYWAIAPMLASIAVAQSSARWEGTGSRYTLKARAQIALSGRKEPLVLQNIYASNSVVPPALELVLMPAQALLTNPHQEVQIEGLTYDLEVTRGFEAALIESAWADRVKARPGDDVTVYVRLRQFRGEETIEKIQVQIPDTAKPGTQVTIRLCDATVNRMLQRSMDPGFFEPPDLDGLINILSMEESNRSLVVRTSIVQQGVRYAGGPMPALPPSALRILEYGEMGGQSAPLTTDTIKSVETPWVLEGSLSLSLAIEEPRPFTP